MPRSKKEKKDDAALLQQSAQTSQRKKQEKSYPTDKLLRSRHLAGYQRDFARVVLKEPAYTLSGAKEALERALKGSVDKR